MSDDITRREMLGWLALVPLASQLAAAEAAHRALTGDAPYAPKFFTPHEWRTVRILVDDVIPRDARSGSATDAGVPEFMDFMMLDHPAGQLPMRGGLHWLDTTCLERFGLAVADCARAQRTALLDDIAWPARARPEMSHGVAFFTMFRNLTASGFWSSRMGVADLRYIGNTVVHEWQGCPPAALAKLGVSY
ncbi:MAG TPA: gluconate 2-dehydrogenase subunit 3 family protein [Gemmatimonadaceae bacterium]|nr:gluconate 2-dehydrogenase subunit 3 family protein [Gemmatimonadaceae bacterium]